MKKKLEKKLVLKKHTVASLDAEKLKELRGGMVDPSLGDDCTRACGGGGHRWHPSDNLSALHVDGLCGCYSQYYWVTCATC
jgi:hypothetical protein